MQEKGSAMICASISPKLRPLLTLFVLAFASFPVLAADGSVSSKVVVEKLYEDYAWVVLFKDPGFVSLTDQPETELLRYFSPSLSGLMHADHRCVVETKDICRLDFDPIYDSQDPSGAHDLHVAPTGHANDVQVSFLPRWGAASAKQLQFKIVNTPAGWRIDDITYPDHESLRAILQQKSGA
jgi:hypothetical protein